MRTQEFNSAETSLKQVACLFKSKWAEFKPDDVVLDYGGGRYNLVANFMADKVAKFHTVDKFNRCEQWNNFHTIAAIFEGCNVVTCANVLNVIKEDDVVDDVIRIVHKITSDRAIFCVYEGDKSGKGRKTQKSSWQRNERAAEYERRIAKYFKNVKRHGNIIVASK